MKFQRLVSSFTPSALQEWLEQELENRGIDSVYSRSILSLLQQDYVDVEPHECQHTRNHQLKVLYKYGGPENSYYATKSKHQKWKTWSKHILLKSASPCCKAAFYDLERILKKTAVDCLKSASDYVNDIEELIDEVWLKLKSKSLKGEQEEIALRNHNPLGHFFIPPSPTDEIEKYFAAFPSLDSKTEHSVEVAQHKLLKNAWCKKCNLKRKSKVRNEEALNSENLNFHSNKSMQPIIPYRSLKTIKNIFKNSGFKSPWKVTCAQRGTSNGCLTYGTKYYKIMASIKNHLSFSNLSSVNINKIYLNKEELLSLKKCAEVQNFLHFNKSSVSPVSVTINSSVTKNLQELSFHILKEESSNIIPFPQFFYDSHPNRYSTYPVDSSQIVFEENSLSSAKAQSDYYGIDIHFRMSPLADLLEYTSPCLEQGDICSEFFQNNTYLDTLKYYYFKMANSCDDNTFKLCTETDVTTCIDPENPTVKKDAFTNHILNSYFVDEKETYSVNSNRTLNIKRNVNNQTENFSGNLSFNPLDTLERSNIKTSLFFSDSESDKQVESMMPSNLDNCSSDDEIYYSDDDSNEIFLSESNENFDFTAAHMQQIEQNGFLNKFSTDTFTKSETKVSSLSGIYEYNLIFNIGSDEAVFDRNDLKHDEKEQKLKVLNFGGDNVNFINVKRQALSSYKELPFLSYSQSESIEEKFVSEQKENYAFQNCLDRKSEIYIKPCTINDPNNSDQIVASSMAKGTEGTELKNSEIYDKKWLFLLGR